ncbi:MAG TPA: outer membrane protein assembly factor BamD [Candidatus Limnocylindria bacterium]|nr:outer membrane protein assembly factor BamD [Candidatus Limnocylindria bacterium]
MNRWILRSLVLLCGLFVFARHCPAPIIYRPGEGWTYEPVGGERKWERKRAKDQLSVAQEAFDRHEYRASLKAAKRVVSVWPLSDYAGPAQYLVGRSYEARKMDERAFKEYQKALTKYPRVTNYAEIQTRQYEIAERFLGGQWFKLWGYIPFFPSMDKTARLFGQVNTNGPYNEIGAKSLLNVGAAREKQKDYAQAVKAYERAADKYYDRDDVASDAIFKAGMAWNKQAKRAEYDQSLSANAINHFEDFRALYPKDARAAQAADTIAALKREQARGAYTTAKFYEKYRKYQGALVYYNEVLAKDPNSEFAVEARERIEALKPKAEAEAKRFAKNDAAALTAMRKAAAQASEDAKKADSEKNDSKK